MKITYIVVGTLLLLASLALASDQEDPVMFLRKLRKETQDTNNKDTRGLGRGGKRALETKEARPTNKNTPGLGRGGKRTLETKQRGGGKRSLAVTPRPSELQMAAAATEGTQTLGPDSCEGQCGGNAGNCYCDDLCDSFGDCCSDVCDECSALSFCPSAPNDLCEGG